VEALRQAARHAGTDVAIANDLGAALVQSGVEHRSPAEVGEGLEVLLRIGGDERPEALFNRALALETLGLRPMAMAAWTSYLAVDSTSPWATEARGRMDALRAPPASPVAVSPQELEKEVLERQLPRWAAASIQAEGGETRAIADLAARTGAQHAEATGDRWLLDATMAVQAADGAGAAALAQGHLAYSRARREYADEDVTACRREAERAANLLASVNSPVAALALLTRASCDFIANDLAAARRDAARARQLVNRRAPPSQLIGGQIAWLEGLLAHAQNRPLEAIVAYRTAVTDFQQARDPEREAVVHALQSDLYNYLGRSDDAWSEAAQAVRNDRLSPTRRYVALRSLIELARREGLDRVALFLARGARANVVRTGLSSFLCESYLDEGRAAESAGDHEGAIQAFDAALQAATAIPDAGARSRSVAHASLELAGLLVAREPDRAKSLLDSAAALAQGEGDFYLDMARVDAEVLQGRGDLAGAEKTLRAAVARSDRERRSLATLRDSDDLFGRRQGVQYALVRLLAARGRAAPALDVLEQWRAEPFGDAVKAASVEDETALIDASTECFAFLALDDELLVWRMSSAGVELTRHAMRREALAERIAAAIDEIQHDARPASAARWLSNLLFGDSGVRAARVVIAPDELLFAVPFSALPGADGGPLMASSELVVTPSMRLWAPRSAGAGVHPSCLLVLAGSPTGGDLYPRLATISNLDAEVQVVRDRYRCSDEAAGVDEVATVDWHRYDVVHYAGHSVVGGANGGALVLQAGEGVVAFEGPAIEKLALPSATVVLSSCEAADGRPSLIAGRDGLARAFLTAGARSVIASLWPVEDDDALELSGELHQRLAAGNDAAAALRAAQLILRGKGRPMRAWAGWRVVE